VQSDIDLTADDIIFKHLKKSGVVMGAASEEKPYVSALSKTFPVLLKSYKSYIKQDIHKNTNRQPS
jgi:fructose-1,6-bisphosphatase